MSHLEVPRFPRGFLLAVRPVDAPLTFVPGPLLPNFYVHPWTNIETAGDHDQFVIVLGHAVSTRPEHSGAAADHLLQCLDASPAALLDALANYSGRYAVVFGSIDNLNIVNDAIGMRSVFYADTGGVVASHAILVEHALGGKIIQSDLPFGYGFPGNRTPYARTKILTPNTYLWVTANVVRRFWPILAPAPRTVEEAAAELLESSAAALREMSRGRTVRLTLTAGLDSRVSLAIARHAGVPVHAYTYGDQPVTKIDQDLAAQLAAQFGIRHTVLGEKKRNPEVSARLTESHYATGHAAWVGALFDHFDHREDLAVLGNALEIGRSNYGPSRRKGTPPPVDAHTMADLHYNWFSDAAKLQVKSYGMQPFKEASAAAFQGFITETGHHNIVGLLDPFDLFYWEHRMAAWQGMSMGERDFYGVPFVPFNARHIYEIMLGVPAAERHADATAIQLLELVDPALLELPVNPRSWPVEARV